MLLYKYRIWCVTENSFRLTDWIEFDKPAPTTCPVNTTHVIDTNSVVIIEQLDTSISLVKLIETDQLDPKLARTIEHGFVLDVPSGVTSAESLISFPFTIEPLGAEFLADYPGVNREDRYDICIIPPGDPVVGVVTTDKAVGSTVIDVSSTVIQNIKRNYLVKFGNDTNEYLVREIGTNSITLASGLVNPIYANDSIRIRAVFSYNRYVYPNMINTIGQWSEGAKNIPANFIIRARIIFANPTTVGFKIFYTVFYKFIE